MAADDPKFYMKRLLADQADGFQLLVLLPYLAAMTAPVERYEQARAEAQLALRERMSEPRLVPMPARAGGFSAALLLLFQQPGEAAMS
ncbi:hypothetical protein CR079_27445, partial [Salmonella enterica subsp. enterica serovar Typhimurium]